MVYNFKGKGTHFFLKQKNVHNIKHKFSWAVNSRCSEFAMQKPCHGLGYTHPQSVNRISQDIYAFTTDMAQYFLMYSIKGEVV